MPISPDPAAAQRTGLCPSCVHSQTVASSKGSTFLLCRLSDVDARFPKYPSLPVLRCGGYQPK
jgi:hypothetical protein